MTIENRSPGGRIRRAGRRVMRWLPNLVDVVVDAITGWW